jgi:hypothetical protein
MFSFPISPVSEDAALNEQRCFLLKNVGSERWNKREEALTDLIHRFGLTECKPVEIDGAHPFANGNCAYLKCSSPGCAFKINIRQITENRVKRFHVKQKESNLVHIARFIDSNGKLHVGDCRGEYEASTVKIEFSFFFKTFCSIFPCYCQADLVEHDYFLSETDDCYMIPPNIKKLQKQLKKYALYPINASVSVIKKAIRTRKFDHNVHEKGFESLLPWLDCMKEENPGLLYRFERYLEGEEGVGPERVDRLKRLALVFPHAAKSFPYLFQVIGIDSAHVKPIIYSLKPTRLLFEGMVLTYVTARTPSNRMIILGVSISPTESSENIQFLLKLLMDAEGEGGAAIPLNSPSIVVASDRGLAIGAAVETLLDQCFHMYCGKHLERNLQKKFRPCKDLISLYWCARSATHSELYDLAMQSLEDFDGGVGEPGKGRQMRLYLESIEGWQLHKLILTDNVMLHMFKSNNIVEAVCGWTKEARHLSPYYCLKLLLFRVFELNNSQRNEAVNREHFLTADARRIFEENLRALRLDHRTVTVTDTVNGVGVVYPSQHAKVLTSLTSVSLLSGYAGRKCFCTRWQQSGVPCIHAIALALKLRWTLEFPMFFHESCLTSTWRRMFEQCPEYCAGVFVTDERIAARALACPQTPLRSVVVPDKIKALIKKRIKSGGDDGGNSFITVANLAKSAKRACPGCGEVISGHTSHPAWHCNAIWRRSEIAKENASTTSTTLRVPYPGLLTAPGFVSQLARGLAQHNAFVAEEENEEVESDSEEEDDLY